MKNNLQSRKNAEGIPFTPSNGGQEERIFAF